MHIEKKGIASYYQEYSHSHEFTRVTPVNLFPSEWLVRQSSAILPLATVLKIHPLTIQEKSLLHVLQAPSNKYTFLSPIVRKSLAVCFTLATARHVISAHWHLK